MAYCSHCGKLAEEGRYCAACGAPIATDAIAVASAQIRRQRREIRLIAVALGSLFVVTVVLVVSHSRRTAEAPPPPPVQVASAPTSKERSLPATTVPDTPSSEPAPQVQAQQKTEQAPPQQDQGSRPAAPPPAPPSAPQNSPSGSDRYPGSLPVNVENVDLPDIGIPVKTEVYTTTDSVATVISYYQQRYPNAELREVNGQNIIAIDRPGATKVIAVSTNGSETRIAIVQPK